MLTSLRQIVLAFSQEPDVNQALARMVTQIKEVMKTDCCSIYLANHLAQHFLLIATDGLSPDSVGQTHIAFSEGLIGLVGQREEPINIANAPEHNNFKYAPEVKEEAYKAFLACPLIHQGSVVGVISVQQKQQRNFNELEEAFLVTLSAQLASAIVNAEARNLANVSHRLHNKKFTGIAGSSGIAMGKVCICQPQADVQSIALQKVYASEQEITRFEHAVTKAKQDFSRITEQLSAFVNDDNLAIFDVYQQLLESAGIINEVKQQIKSGWSAESALKRVIDSYVVQFSAIEDSYIKERATDVKDLGNRLLHHLQQANSQKLPEQAFVLVAKEVTASMLAEHQAANILAIVSLTGSNNSHAAILARALGLPAIMGLDDIPLEKLSDQYVIVDGYRGELIVSPDHELRNEYHYLLQEEGELARKVNEVAHLPAVTLDGANIEICLNAGLMDGMEQQKQCGALGIGLYRTELLFMERKAFPTEQQQTQWYQTILQQYPKHHVTMRTLDIGGDKSLPYFPIQEDNPFLGWRGLRISLDHPEIFLQQIKAMMRANQATKNLEILLPMVTSFEELNAALRLINQAYYELNEELNKQLARPRIGVMLEVPSTLFLFEEMAKKVDFFSVGSNDLTQYLLAVDRNNARVANLHDGFNPAVLRALNLIAEKAKQAMVPLSICGELAGEPAGALLLFAMGYDKLSMNAHNVAKIKWIIRHIELQRAKIILAHALTLSSATQVRHYLNDQLEKLGLGGFVRAGM